MRLILLAALLALLPAPKRPDVAAPAFWQPLPAPERGSWRDRYPEEGQTFVEYQASDPSRPTAQRVRIVLQPWLTRAPRDPQLRELLQDLLQAFFGRDCATLPPAAMPARAWLPERRQFDVHRLLARLVRTLPADGILVLALTDRDLHLDGFEFAHGGGALDLRAAVASTHRMGGGTGETRRVLSTALHEACHALSMPHCPFFPCLMNGALTRGDIDRRPLLLCPVCRAKLCWNLGLDVQERYLRLAAALERAGLATDAARVRAAATASRDGERRSG